jgi:Flp pilus assembly protein TadD
MPNQLTQRLRAIGQDFSLEILAGEVSRHPENLEALRELASELTAAGKLCEGLTIDRKLARLLPDEPEVHYNLACSLALLGDADDAFRALLRAAELGYDDLAHLERDRDLEVLRDDPRFDAVRRAISGSSRIDI